VEHLIHAKPEIRAKSSTKMRAAEKNIMYMYLHEEKEVKNSKRNKRKRAHTKEDQWSSESEDVESGIGSDQEYPPLPQQ
jgi:hypothetical protein